MNLPRAFSFVTPCVLATALLAGCGGGGSGDETPTASVATLSATPVSYSRVMTVTVIGRNLSQGIQLDVDDGGCGPVSRGTASNESQQFLCQVLAIGDLTARVRNLEGGELASLSLKVPPPRVAMTVTQGSRSGTFVLELDAPKAPLTVQNFLAYVSSGFYRNTLFHRVIASFVAQAGGFTSGPTAKPPTREPIALESNNGLLNLRGTIAMARTSEPNSATAQFYLNLESNPDLDYKDETNPGYAVFGRVVAGQEIVDEIGIVPVRVDPPTGLSHLPVTDVVITAATQIR